MRPTFTGSILLAKILFINSIILQSLRQTMCSRSFSFYFLGPVFVVQQLGRLSNWKKKKLSDFFFFFFFGMHTARDNLKDILGVLKSPVPVMGGRVFFRSYFSFFAFTKELAEFFQEE